MKAWKAEEQRVANAIGMRRRPLSGNSQAGIGAGDIMNLDGTQMEDAVFEVKSWKRMPLIKHIDKVRKEAEKKNWVFVIHEKGSHRRFAIVDYEYFVKLYKR